MNNLDGTEFPVVFGKQSGLFGIVTEPNNVRNDLGVIILSAGLLPLEGPFRLHVSLAREIANKISCRVIRIDQTGRGESETIRSDAMGEDTPFLDIEDAISQLGSEDLNRFVVIGFCSGADDLLPALEKLPHITGAVLFDPYAVKNTKYYLKHYLPRLLNLPLVFRATVRNIGLLISWMSSAANTGEDSVDAADFRDWKSEKEMLGFYKKYLDRGGKFIAAFTEPFYYSYEGQLKDNLISFGVSKSSIEGMFEIKIDKAEHTYPVVAHRRQVIDQVCKWLAANFDIQDDRVD